MRAPFGEFLVQRQILDRFQLFRTLQLQDRVPGARLGHCAVALGFVPAHAIERLHLVFELGEAEPDLETMQTEGFLRPDFEIHVAFD
jgi:hypothetical protein